MKINKKICPNLFPTYIGSWGRFHFILLYYKCSCSCHIAIAVTSVHLCAAVGAVICCVPCGINRIFTQRALTKFVMRCNPPPMPYRRNVCGWLAVYIVQSVIYPACSTPYSVVAIALSTMNFFYSAHQRLPLDVFSHCQHLLFFLHDHRTHFHSCIRNIFL